MNMLTKKVHGNTGKLRSLETRLKIALSHLGKSSGAKGKLINVGSTNSKWKGNRVGYRALHYWVERQLGKAKECQECGLTKIPKGLQRYFGWANKSHKYKRDTADWMQLCMQCHKIYDKQYEQYT